MEGNFSLSISYHYEQWLAFHHDGHIQQGIKISQGLSKFQLLVVLSPSLGIVENPGPISKTSWSVFDQAKSLSFLLS
jgi:hypothetical protein